jgi:hypothetical protein
MLLCSELYSLKSYRKCWLFFFGTRMYLFEPKIVKTIHSMDNFFPKEKRMCAWLQASNRGAKVFVGEQTLAPFFFKVVQTNSPPSA